MLHRNKFLNFYFNIHSSSDTYPEWYSDELISKIIKKKKLHKLWFEFGNEVDRDEFEDMRD